MVPDSSAICLRSSRIVSGSGSSSTRNWPHEPLPLFNEENKVGLRTYQALRHGCAIEISRNQLLKFAGLQPHVEPGAGRCCGEPDCGPSIAPGKGHGQRRAEAFSFGAVRLQPLLNGRSLPPATFHSSTRSRMSARSAIKRSADSVQSRSWSG